MDQNLVITIVAMLLFICCVAPMIMKARRRRKTDAPKRENDTDTKREE
ncbi:hypothetical protein [Brevundimonas sp.]